MATLLEGEILEFHAKSEQNTRTTKFKKLDIESSQSLDENLKNSLELAAKGVGLVSPNPLVGCVIVSTDGEVVGEGTYVKDNVTHAEAIALGQAGEKAKGGTAYVSLEPHDHHGKTPPCTEALINAGIKRVVVPIEDPNPLVSGSGFERLRNAGVEVVTGILAEEASRLNEKFICWHKKGRPFVHLKLAMSLDGRISLTDSVSTALSGDDARKRVQELRHEHDAILVGSTTALVDNPALTDRSGMPRRRPLVRVILDNNLRLPLTGKLAVTAKETPTLVMTNCLDIEKIKPLQDAGVEVVPVTEGARNLAGVLEELKKREIQSVLVEGGTAVAGAFVDAGLVDKLTFIMAPIIIGGQAPAAIGGKGVESLADALRLKDVTVTHHGADIEVTGYPQ
ncbi:MAG: bifunctional diaminohydroxyphosphoribosylaminopyrimidine deaminase/5-amino-6-(5-phosphoribosylamino)uracil reductase RibD [Acidobacteria bacterium]|nr:bifunctional diaminohydroxyphosphoribosylaminopyrimidine deaminase/5-amino-6-(5-phosphoribosylamino)uracil reductase RibD [Acidobacteriota bacterium]